MSKQDVYVVYLQNHTPSAMYDEVVAVVSTEVLAEMFIKEQGSGIYHYERFNLNEW